MAKKYDVVYLPVAENDLTEIVDYIAMDSPRSAQEMLNKIDETILMLQEFPLMGVVPNDDKLKRQGYRMLIVENYVIFYVVEGDVVEVRRVLHGKRNYTFLL